MARDIVQPSLGEVSRRRLFAFGAAALVAPVLPQSPAPMDAVTAVRFDSLFEFIRVQSEWSTIKVGDVFTFGEATKERWVVTHAD